MSQFGSLYSQYYDLLYQDKDYVGEVEYIEKLIKNNIRKAETILELGCGTGRHAELLCEKGYVVHGIDISEDMLKIAEKRRVGKEGRLSFSCSNIQNLNIDKKFDVVISLFHVMSYQTTNEEVIKTFKVVKNHLKKDGIFIFDFWYGPAVLTHKPEVRIKRLENENIKITRIAEPKLVFEKNIVEVHYTLFIEDKQKKEIKEIKELHKMRFFFDTELLMVCEKTGLKVINKYEWMTDKYPDFNSWYVVWIVKN